MRAVHRTRRTPAEFAAMHYANQRAAPTAECGRNGRHLPQPGDVVEIAGLASEAARGYNGMRAVVRKFVQGKGRWQLALRRGGKLLAIKDRNISVPSFREHPARRHAALEVWPRAKAEVRAAADVPVSPVEGWPSTRAQEVRYLRSGGWRDPRLVEFTSEARRERWRGGCRAAGARGRRSLAVGTACLGG